ncbi:hypothetical protein [Burkholderia gladioli]|uniref:hypothetical protein n=1 Tax=Burkholderia gladioli TaxID=28095 RepID=UPI000BBD3FC8|nr:hypothetical protein [Burkholderia gladioli]ATF84690.1 hypothetical protein CO712_06260 [Burkholderia gladioli pv. gladioli]MBJ9663144.1 hypothetical protein [Burkholderia gladioli]MBJ9714692.1 hypothetical protein [Burkholderia gladioli]MBU9154918.1 hypothetical protein [Burkholderia gladioli]MCH7269336.1 hypothetical protein [Burkholderia gladioli]
MPLAQYVTAPVKGVETPVAREGDRYRPEDDPLQRVPVAQGDARVMFYYCDQIGTDPASFPRTADHAAIIAAS